jgi:hypothetical protein
MVQRLGTGISPRKPIHFQPSKNPREMGDVKSGTETGLLRALQFSLSLLLQQCAMPILIYTYQKDNGLSLGTSKQSYILSDVGENWPQKYLHRFLFDLKMTKGTDWNSAHWRFVTLAERGRQVQCLPEKKSSYH